MPDINLKEFERMRNGGARTSVRVQPAGTRVDGYQVNLGNRPSLRDIGVVGAPAWTADKTETWVRIERLSATCPRRLTVFEGGPDLGSAVFVQYHGAATDTFVDPLTIPVGALIYEANVRTASASHNLLWGVGVNAENSGDRLTIQSWTGGVRYAYSSDGTTLTTLSESPYFSANTWYRLKIVFSGSVAHFYVNGDEIASGSSAYFPDTAIGLFFFKASAPIGAEQAWAFVRKYVAAEPVAGTAQPSALNRSMCQSISLADGLRACCAA